VGIRSAAGPGGADVERAAGGGGMTALLAGTIVLVSFV
jgi:hypothetical protein